MAASRPAQRAPRLRNPREKASEGLMMMLRRVLAVLFAGVMSVSAVQAQSSAGKLRVYFVDVEGGQATLFVTPEGHSLLIDTGWPGNNGRDADRIVAAAKSAGLSRIDDVLITHYHDD